MLRSVALCGVVAVTIAVVIVAPQAFGADGALQATVTVVAPDEPAYGAAVWSCTQCLHPEEALGQPDGEGAVVWHNGEIVLALERTIPDCRQVGVWAKQIGWGPGHVRLYVSEDGKKWKHAGNSDLPSGFGLLSFQDDFGDVAYIRVARSGWVLGVLVLDAVGAVGGGR